MDELNAKIEKILDQEIKIAYDMRSEHDYIEGKAESCSKISELCKDIAINFAARFDSEFETREEYNGVFNSLMERNLI